MNDLRVIRVTRVAMALLFVVSGIQKLLTPAMVAPLFEKMGLPWQLAYAVGAFELCSGLAFIVAFQLRWVALALSAWSIATALVGHQFWVDPSQIPNFLKNVGLSGAFLLFALPGGARTTSSAD